MDFITIIISGISLFIAIASYFAAKKSQVLQYRINEIELKLKELELAEKEKEQQKEACVEANIVHVSKSNYKLKIWNSGKAIAKNVSASWDSNSEIMCFDNDKMPFEFLEPQKGFDLAITKFIGAANKICITTEWEDEAGEKHSKTQWCDF